MKITFLGVGSAFSKLNFNSSMLIELPQAATNTNLEASDSNDHLPPERLLIDCGRTSPESLMKAGLAWKDIDALYISHQHSDHAGGMEEFGFMRYFMPSGKPQPKLFINRKLADRLWQQTLKGGMEYVGQEPATLSTFFNVQAVDRNHPFEFGNVVFHTLELAHCANSYGSMMSYGLNFSVPTSGKGFGKRVFITTDSMFQPMRVMSEYDNSDIIFQDCETYDWQTGKSKSGVHAHYRELLTLPEEIRSKMWLYHYQDARPLPDAKADGFAGFVEQGQVFEL